MNRTEYDTKEIQNLIRCSTYLPGMFCMLQSNTDERKCTKNTEMMIYFSVTQGSIFRILSQWTPNTTQAHQQLLQNGIFVKTLQLVNVIIQDDYKAV